MPNPLTKKKRKQPVTAKLSFDRDEDDEPANHSKRSKSASAKDDESDSSTRKRLGPNTSVVAPKVMTKSAQLKEIGKKELLRKEFLLMQEAVKATEFEIPFVFFDGTNNPGGRCRIKKGEHVWLFLDRSRKIGADLGVTGGEGGRTGTRREWARISVDDLMLVRGEIIIPHVSVPIIELFVIDFASIMISITLSLEGLKAMMAKSCFPMLFRPPSHRNSTRLMSCPIMIP